jgi:hypothetical protein
MATPAAMLDQLGRLAGRLRAAEDRVTRLRAERADLYVRLASAGLTQKQIAAAAGVTKMAVKFVLDKAHERAAAS